MLRFITSTLLLIYLLVLGGCALSSKSKFSDEAALWPQYRHDAGLTGHSPLKGGLDKTPGELWTADLGGALVPTEQIRIEDLNGDGHKEVLRLAKDRIICQDLRGKKLWEAAGLSNASITDIRDWAGDGKLGLLVECAPGVGTQHLMVSGTTGKVTPLYNIHDSFGGHNRTGHILPGVSGQQLCIWWDGKNNEKNLGTDNMTGYGYLWSFEKGVDQPTLRFSNEASGIVYSGQHLFADMDGDGLAEFVMISHENMWLFDAATGKQKAFFHWEPEIRSYVAQIAAVPLKKGALPALLEINPMIPGVEAIAQDGKGTATRLWKKVLGSKEDQYQMTIKIGPGAHDPFIDLDGDGVAEILVSVTNEHGDGKMYLVIFNAANGERIYDKLSKTPTEQEAAVAWGHGIAGTIVTVDDLDGDGRPEILFNENDTLKIADWNGSEFIPRWSGAKVEALLMPAPPEGRLDRCTIVGYNAPLWREQKDSSNFLLRFPDGVYSCELPKGGELKKLRKIERHEALGNLKKIEPLDNYNFDGKTLATFGDDGKEVYHYEVPRRRDYSSPSPIVGRLGNVTRVLARTSEGTLISLDTKGNDRHELLRQSPAARGVNYQGYNPLETPIICDIDGDGKNEVVTTTIDGGKPCVVFLDEQGNIKQRIEAIPTTTQVLLGVTGSLGPGQGRWLVVRYNRQFERIAVAAYEGKTGRQLWLRDSYTNEKEPYTFMMQLPTSVYDYDGDGADDLLTYSGNHYGIISVKDNRDLVPPMTITAAIPGHWSAYGTPMLAHFSGEGKPQLFFSRAFCNVLATDLTGQPLWHYGQTRDTTARAHCGLTDLDGDGKTEVVVSQADGLLQAFDNTPVNQKCPICPPKEPLTAANHAGRPRWTFRLPGPVSDITTADLDNDGHGELLVGAGDGILYALKEVKGECKVLWSTDLGAPVGSPVLADLNGDGKAEIIVATGDGRLHCLGEK